MAEEYLEEGDYVIKTFGYEFPGWVVAAFETRTGKVRYVVESERAPGLLHIFSGEQLTKVSDI